PQVLQVPQAQQAAAHPRKSLVASGLMRRLVRRVLSLAVRPPTLADRADLVDLMGVADPVGGPCHLLAAPHPVTRHPVACLRVGCHPGQMACRPGLTVWHPRCRKNLRR
ncbi:MAG: hypothetical protein KGO01_20285, partial [Burkholderiales bacterium]|nr:hypothetical protein [Burkholderiales bacterium]